jgi:cobalamin biosynthesis protein CobT
MGKAKKERKQQRAERAAAPQQEQVTQAVQETSTATAMPDSAPKKRGKKFGHN